MDVTIGPAACLRGADDVLDHARRAADVDVGAERLGRQQSLEGNGLTLTVVVHVKTSGFAPVQSRKEGGVLGGSNRIMQFVGHPRRRANPRAAPEKGRDADAAGDQHVLAGNFIESKQVHRMGDFQAAADLYGVVHVMRSATGLLHAAHADFVAIQLTGCAEQRIGVAMHAIPALHDNDDVRAARKRRQAAAAERCKLEVLDQRRDLFDADHFDGQGLRVVHRKISLTAGSSPGASASTITPM